MDEDTSIALDKEFKANLKFIRPYIIKLTNPKYITSCRVWLEKMSNCRPEEKSVRNEYLSELCRQIQSDKIVEPFINAPPEGPLLDLGIPCSSTSWSDISTASTNTEVPGSGDCDTTTENLTPQDNITYPNIYESKIKEQQMVIDELKKNNDFLKTELHQYEVKMNTRNSKAEVGINMLATEVDYLKERLKELIIMKRNLQASHNAVIMQWEESTRTLETELQNEKDKSLLLEAKVKELTKNLEEAHEPNVCKQIEQKLLEVHHTEICNIQEKHSEVIKYIEDKHSQLIHNKELEHEQAVRELKHCYEQKLEELSLEAEKNCKFRDEEIGRLEKLIEIQCHRDQQLDQDCTYTNDSLVEKISFLQNCILKMERLLRKYEKHYSKKVSFLTKELQMKENTLQIQLTTQRAQLLAKASSERQVEIEDIVTQLEERYRTLLEDQQAQVVDIRQEYSNLISKLSEKFEVKAIKSA